MIWNKQQIDMFSKLAVEKGCSIAEAEQAAGRAIAEELERERVLEQAKKAKAKREAEANALRAELERLRHRRQRCFAKAVWHDTVSGEVLPCTLTDAEAAEFDKLTTDIAVAESRLQALTERGSAT